MNTEKGPMFDIADVDDLVRGAIREDSGTLVCLYCAKRFEAGLVYPIEAGLALADRALEDHVATVHGGPFSALLSRGGERAGLTEIQEKVLRLLASGTKDKEIAAELGGKSESTVRNHRFNLRRKASEARAFLALFRLVEEGAAGTAREAEGGALLEYPASMPLRDERAVITEAEAAAVEARCLGKAAGGAFRIVFWPKKQKEKLVLLNRIALLFAPERTYTEPEVNEILMPIYGDYVTIRRYLIEYRFIDRKPDGSAYWRVKA